MNSDHSGSACDCPPDACLCGFAETFNAQQEKLREEATGWHDAGRSAFWAFERLSDATTLHGQASALNDLSNAMADLVTWLPGWDWEHGVLNDPDASDETQNDRSTDA